MSLAIRLSTSTRWPTLFRRACVVVANTGSNLRRQRRCLVASDSRGKDRTRTVGTSPPAMHGRRDALARRHAEAAVYLASFGNDSSPSLSDASKLESLETTAKDEKAKEVEGQLRLEEERVKILLEAGAITRSLYRTCLRSLNVLRPGNEHDEADFKAREHDRLKELEEPGSFSFAPPVDRENELGSRANYYHSWARENFEQESDCLQHEPLREEDLDRYFHFIRTGEERRKWILKDYKFDDPYPKSFDFGRVDHFEASARELLRKTPSIHWMHSLGVVEGNLDSGEYKDDSFFDEHEDEQ